MKLKQLCALTLMVSLLSTSLPTECMWRRIFSKETASLVDAQLAKELRSTKRYIFANRLGNALIGAGALTAAGGIAYGASFGNGEYAQIPSAFCIVVGLGLGGTLALTGGITRFAVRRLSGMSQRGLVMKRELIEKQFIKDMLAMQGLKTPSSK